jgi:hypothetical protein
MSALHHKEKKELHGEDKGLSGPESSSHIIPYQVSLIAENLAIVTSQP